jgi:hypothetical protein
MNVEDCCKGDCGNCIKPKQEMPIKCIEMHKELKMYLADSREFISKCNTCPVATKLVVNADKLIEKLK